MIGILSIIQSSNPASAIDGWAKNSRVLQKLGDRFLTRGRPRLPAELAANIMKEHLAGLPVTGLDGLPDVGCDLNGDLVNLGISDWLPLAFLYGLPPR